MKSTQIYAYDVMSLKHILRLQIVIVAQLPL